MEDWIRTCLAFCTFAHFFYSEILVMPRTQEYQQQKKWIILIMWLVAYQARKHNSVFCRVPDPFSSRTNFQRSVINSILADLLFPSFKQNSSWHWETTPKPWRKRAKRHATATKYKPNPSFITLRLHYWVQVFSTPQKYESSQHKLQAHYNSSPTKP